MTNREQAVEHEALIEEREHIKRRIEHTTHIIERERALLTGLTKQLEKLSGKSLEEIEQDAMSDRFDYDFH